MTLCLLILNAGSSSLKFTLFEANAQLTRIVGGTIENPGSAASCLAVVLQKIQSFIGDKSLAAIGHRVVHGGPRYSAPERVTTELLQALRALSPIDPEHLPSEIALLEAARARFPNVPQLVCFDTAFHRDLPRVARLLPIPRRYEKAGVRRYGFHGLSYEFLLEELARLGDAAARTGRVIFAHLGNGASLAAVRDGKCIDTTMAFTPTAGLPMGTRSGDLDPGLVDYLARTEGMTAAQFQDLVNHRSGLLGVSEISSDVRELLKQETSDVRAAEAIDLFCYQIKKSIGAYAAALGGVDTLVFSGGIGENNPAIRSRICAGLDFLGLTLHEPANAKNAAVLSASGAGVAVRVIPTDEARMIARAILAQPGFESDPAGKTLL